MFSFLEPLFVVVGIELAIVALYILVVTSILVGLSLGVFLPSVLPGAFAGVGFSAFVGCFFECSSTIFFATAAPSFALIGAGVSMK